MMKLFGRNKALAPKPGLRSVTADVAFFGPHNSITRLNCFRMTAGGSLVIVRRIIWSDVKFSVRISEITGTNTGTRNDTNRRRKGSQQRERFQEIFLPLLKSVVYPTESRMMYNSVAQ
jgi:hypothetical protein